jgi:hypothetical protein
MDSVAESPSCYSYDAVDGKSHLDKRVGRALSSFEAAANSSQSLPFSLEKSKP